MKIETCKLYSRVLNIAAKYQNSKSIHIVTRYTVSVSKLGHFFATVWCGFITHAKTSSAVAYSAFAWVTSVAIVQCY